MVGKSGGGSQTRRLPKCSAYHGASDKNVMKYLPFLLGFAMLLAPCRAETRWCRVAGTGPGDSLSYPETARQMRVFGVVHSRMKFSTDGKVIGLEYVSGPRLLANLLERQMKSWTIRTNARGNALCQTLVVAVFDLDSYGQYFAESAINPAAPSVFRLSVSAESPAVEFDVSTDYAEFSGFSAYAARPPA
jgi:hypothetical protein